MLKLRYRHEFDAVFDRARKIKSGFLTVLMLQNDLGMPRLGMVIAKRYVRTATKRNRLKRLIRAAFRHQVEQIGSYDLVVMAQKLITDYPQAVWGDEVKRTMVTVSEKLIKK